MPNDNFDFNVDDLLSAEGVDFDSRFDFNLDNILADKNFLNPDFFDVQEFNLPSTTKTIGGRFPYNEKLHNLIITKGKWKFTIDNTIGDVPFDVIKDTLVAYSNREGAQFKRYEILDHKYFPERNQSELIVNVIDNPIPLAVIWGAVAVATLITGAIAIDSILVDVSKFVDDIGSSPLVIGILLIFLVPILISGGKFLKGKGK